MSCAQDARLQSVTKPCSHASEAFCVASRSFLHLVIESRRGINESDNNDDNKVISPVDSE